MGSHVSTAASPRIAVRDVSREIMDHARRIVQAVRTGSKAAEASVGLSAAQLFVLSRLSVEPTLSVNDLAQRTATHQSSVSVVVSKLVAMRLVRRTRSRSDARVARISITPLGRIALRKAPESTQDALIHGLARLGREKQRRLSALLGEWLAASGIDTAPPPMFFENSPVKRANRNVPTRS